MKAQVRRTALLAPLFLAVSCSQEPSASLTSPSNTAAVTLAADGRVGASAAGDVKVGSGALEIVRLRMDRQTSSGTSIVRQYANPGQTLAMNRGETIELWAEYPPEVANPRFRVDWGDGVVDITGCGSCLLRHSYPAEGNYMVRASLDDRVSTTATRTFSLDSRAAVAEARRLIFALDNTNGYSATIESGARIIHPFAAGSGPLQFPGMQMAFGPASTAVFPGVTQLGNGVSPPGGPSSPRAYVTSNSVFTLKVLSSGKLYEGRITFWGDAGDSFCCPDGVPPLPGNPRLASAAFNLVEILK